jgi:hypothetical protein
MKPQQAAATATKTRRNPIEPVTLIVTLTGRKAAAFRRMARYDETTHQEAADTAISRYVAAFTEWEKSDRSDRKKARELGITVSELRDREMTKLVGDYAEPFAEEVAAGVVAKLNAGGEA